MKKGLKEIGKHFLKTMRVLRKMSITGIYIAVTLEITAIHFRLYEH